MKANLISIHPDNPQSQKISQVVEALKSGQVIIYPTDGVYGIGCSLFEPKAIKQICQIKQQKSKKLNFAIICRSLSDISGYAKYIDDDTFRMMKKYLPGPYTFILEASHRVPKVFGMRKKEIAVKMLRNNITSALVEQLGHPILNTSIEEVEDKKISTYLTEPSLIYEKYQKQVDIVIDGGIGKDIPSSIIDCTADDITLVRQGVGEVETED